MNKEDEKGIDRRTFLQTVGIGAMASAAVTAGLTGCDSKNSLGTSPFQYQTGEVPTDKMTYRTHPRTGDRVSLLGYGCMRWPTRQRSDNSGTEIDQEMVNQLIDYAIEHGVNYFDTAPVYGQGQSEVATGIALKRHPRDKWFIATKMSSPLHGNPDLGACKAMYEASFERLQIDRIDYYLLHGAGIGGMEPLQANYFDNGLLDYLLKEREAGRIRNFGFSFHGEVEAFNYLLAQDVKWDFVQVQLNYADWKNASGWNFNAEYLYRELEKRHIPAVVMEPLLGGRLARLNAIALELLKKFHSDDNPAKWAFRYAGTPANVLTVLSGMTYMEHLQDNIRTYSPLETITAEEDATLQQVAELILKSEYIPCTTCQYCMPCPYGIDIPAIFSHYNRCISDDNMPKDSQDENYRKARRTFLVGYDRSIPRLRQASHCTNCGQCTPKCTQSMQIPEEMIKIDKYVEQLKTTVM
jgi:predicted aldo/keto reductase-like oxidoreductase